MKKILLGLSLIIVSVFARAQQGLENIIVEKYYVSDANDAAGAAGNGDNLPAGSVTYRIYADMLPGYKFQAAFGTQDNSQIPLHTLKVETSTSFYNNTDRGHEIPSFSKSNASQNTTMLDSYFSAGAACANSAGPVYNYGILKADDGAAGGTNVVNANGLLQNNDPSAGIPLTTADGIYGVSSPAVSTVTFVNMAQEQDDFDAGPSSSSFITTNASWASLAGATGPTADNRVLIGQFTTNGCFHFELNIQIGTPTGGVQKYVAAAPTGAEILFPACIYPPVATNTASVTIAPSPVVPLCAGSSITFAATPALGGAVPSYQWKKNNVNDGTNSATYTTTVASGDVITCVLTSNQACVYGSPATSNSITILPPPTATAGNVSGCAGSAIALSGSPAGGNFSVADPYTGPSTTYTYTYTDGNGCSATSAPATITVNPLPTVTAGNVSGCAGSAIALSGSPAGGDFSVANPYTGPSTTYTYTYTDGNGCTNTSAPATITVNPLPTVTAGNVSGCAGTSIALSGSPAGGNFSVANPYTGPSTTYTYSYTDGNGCSNTSAAATITVNPLPTVTAGNVSGCAGSAITLSGSPAGGNFSVANPYTGPSTTYTYSYTDGNGCSNTSAPANITVNPLPTGSFTGLAATYNVSAPAATLTGSPAGGTFSGPGISGNTFNPSVAGIGGPYTITYSFTNGNGCSNSATHQTTVTSCAPPAMPGTISLVSGNGKVCPGESRTYKISVTTGATSYTWTPPAGATIASGQGTRLVQVDYTAGFTTGGTLSVVANNACGSGPARTLSILRNNPSTPSVISGSANSVCNGSGLPYSVTNVAGLTFNWSFNNANASIASGQGTNAITANFNSSYLTGTLSVNESNGCGTSASRNVVIKTYPAVPGAISGATTVCAHQNGVPYSIAPVAGATVYTWQAPNGSHISDGVVTSPSRTLVTTATSVTVNFGGNAGNISVKAGNACGYSAFKLLPFTFVCRTAETKGSQFDVSAYPNPSSGDFTIEVMNASDEKTSITVMDATGRIVQNLVSSTANSTIRISDLLPGVYTALLTNGENNKVLKLIKVN